MHTCLDTTDGAATVRELILALVSDGENLAGKAVGESYAQTYNPTESDR
jgi:hypothetical protein